MAKKLEKTEIILNVWQLIIGSLAFFGALAGFLMFIVTLIKNDFAKETQDHWEQRYSVIYNDQKKLAEESAKLLELYKKKYPKMFVNYK